MAKHNIEASSTSCGAAGHAWKPGLAANYRQCGQCRKVEVFLDGGWISPTGRGVKASAGVVLARTLMQDAGVLDRDLQAEVKLLVEVEQPVVSEVEKYRAARLSAGEKLFAWGKVHEYPDVSFSVAGRPHTIAYGVSAWRSICFHAALVVIEAALESAVHQELLPAQPEIQSYSPTIHSDIVRRELGEKLFAWGSEHGYPQLSVQVPERVYTIADSQQSQIQLSDHIRKIVSGEAAWRVVCFHGLQVEIEAALKQIQEVPAEVVPQKEQIMHIERTTINLSLEEIQEWFLRMAEQEGYPELRFQVADDGVTYRIVPGGEAAYKERAQSASHSWLWNALQALSERRLAR